MGDKLQELLRKQSDLYETWMRQGGHAGRQFFLEVAAELLAYTTADALHQVSGSNTEPWAHLIELHLALAECVRISDTPDAVSEPQDARPGATAMLMASPGLVAGLRTVIYESHADIEDDVAATVAIAVAEYLGKLPVTELTWRSVSP